MIDQVDRYGEAIEFDLHERFQLDLLDFIRGQYSRRKLAVLIERLPLASHYWQAKAADPDYAAEVLAAEAEAKKAGEKSPEHHPPLSEWTPEVGRLADLIDLVQSLLHVTMAANGGSPGNATPAARPRTAIDEAKRNAEQAESDSLVQEVKQAQETWLRLREGGADAGSN